MKNFLRALRFAWPYRWRFLVSVGCAMMVAILWGANLSAIYPVLNILGSSLNLHEWVDQQLARYTRDVERYSASTDHYDRQLKAVRDLPQNKELDRWIAEQTGKLAKDEASLSSARSQLYWYQLAKVHLLKYCPTDRFMTLVALLCLIVVAVVIKGVFDYWQESLVGSVVYLAVFDLRNRFYRHVIHQDVRQFSDQGTHQLMARFTNDMENLATGMKTLCGRMIAEPMKAIACVSIACFINWRLTLLFLIIVPLALLLMSKVAIYMKRAGRRVLDSMSSLYKILQETFQGIRVVQAFTMERYERRRLFLGAKDYYRRGMKVVNIDAASGPIMEVLASLAVAGALLVGGYLVIQAETQIWGIKLTEQPMNWIALLQLYTLLVAIADPVRKLSNVYNKMQSAAAAADRIFDCFDRVSTIDRNVQGPRLPRHAQRISFRDVCFSYRRDTPILSHVNLDIAFGETIALVGKNGCGKSTLVGLLMRFYDPDHGAIAVDGLDLRAANLRSLRQQVGLVTQDTILFDDTIFNNIAYGHRHASEAQVEEAARRAYAHDFIAKLPSGYQTHIGEMGNALSVGERHRLCLAGAFGRDPAIMILDEATSAADLESEALIHQALKEFTRNRTTILITHRLSMLEIVDRIIVLDQGRIEAIGTHDTLLQSCATYQRLHEVQFQRKAA